MQLLCFDLFMLTLDYKHWVTVRIDYLNVPTLNPLLSLPSSARSEV